MSKTIDELVQKVQFLNEKVVENQSKLQGMDIDFQALKEATQKCDQLIALSEQSEALRAQLSQVVSQANQIMASVKEEFQKTKKVIKANIEPERWHQFGVQDKR